MKKPKMIMFDYGQTLISETGYDPEKGTAAVMQYAVGNKHCRSAQEVQAAADAVRAELGRSDPKNRHMFNVEIPNHMFTSYLYQSMGVELSLTPPEIDRVFWDAASPGKPTDGIEDFLAFLKEKHIRTGVISNIPYCGGGSQRADKQNAASKRFRVYHRYQRVSVPQTPQAYF